MTDPRWPVVVGFPYDVPGRDAQRVMRSRARDAVHTYYLQHGCSADEAHAAADALMAGQWRDGGNTVFALTADQLAFYLGKTQAPA